MGAFEYDLADPPEGDEREQWLAHAAGFILVEDVRQYAVERIDPALPDAARTAAEKGINDALYGLMMVIDGVSGWLRNADYEVHVDSVVRLSTREGVAVAAVDLAHSDGMCIAYHGWVTGDFGETPVAVPRRDDDAR